MTASEHRHPVAPYLAEALGTFALVFAGPGAAAVNAASGGGVAGVGIGLSFGLAVMTAIFTFGHISGAHINPAVSSAFRALRRIDNAKFAGYVCAQLCGAALAGLAIYAILGDRVAAAATVPGIGGWGSALASEVILTFFLTMVILAVATDDRAQGGIRCDCDRRFRRRCRDWLGAGRGRLHEPRPFVRTGASFWDLDGPVGLLGRSVGRRHTRGGLL